MLGADRSAELLHHVMHHLLDLVPQSEKGRIAAGLWRIEIEMQVAVAQMAEADRPRAWGDSQHRRHRLGQEIRDGRDGNGNIVLDGGAFALLALKLLGADIGPWGIPTIVISIFFFGGVQLVFLGIIGEYIVSIFNQVRRRPLVVERERINFVSVDTEDNA